VEGLAQTKYWETRIGNTEYTAGGSPSTIDIGLGTSRLGDTVFDFSYCLDCGQLQGTFPLPKTRDEKYAEGEALDEEE